MQPQMPPPDHLLPQQQQVPTRVTTVLLHLVFKPHDMNLNVNHCSCKQLSA
jgi:hypothetical protein